MADLRARDARRRRARSTWSAMTGVGASWCGSSAPDPTSFAPGSPTPPGSVTSTSSGTTSPRSGRPREKASNSSSNRSQPHPRSAGRSSRCSASPPTGPWPSPAAVDEVMAAVHPRPLPLGRRRGPRMGARLQRHPQARARPRPRRRPLPLRRRRNQWLPGMREHRSSSWRGSATGGCSRTRPRELGSSNRSGHHWAETLPTG